ncbi:hypothetical protein VK792_07380 [Mesobacterium sp. TK19101]|uniref:N-acetyltransferase domain-containing protein n=1 Tax=Mesobacterium hydrothermale TaxID=3111907 RepID=A0ABU6HF65_9RHOB|nr:hypothetical protein [Mesobacterium sp. TK19101]MEC3861104.1 hypothetical protein [Mesobacterium sp. TK19101]
MAANHGALVLEAGHQGHGPGIGNRLVRRLAGLVERALAENVLNIDRNGHFDRPSLARFHEVVRDG